jgi:hypothetical protein
MILRPGHGQKRQKASLFLLASPLSFHCQTLLMLRLKMNIAEQPSTIQTDMKSVPSAAKVVRFNDTINCNDLKVGSQYAKGEGVACRWESSNCQRSGRHALRRRRSFESKPHNATDCFSSPPPSKRSIILSPPSIPQRKNSMDRRDLLSSSDQSNRKTSLDYRLQFEESASSLMPLADSDNTLRHFSESDSSSLATDPWSPLLEVNSERSAPKIPQRFFSEEFSSIDASIEAVT